MWNRRNNHHIIDSDSGRFLDSTSSVLYHDGRNSSNNSNQSNHTYSKRSPLVMNRIKNEEGDVPKERNQQTSTAFRCILSIFTHLAFGVVTFHIGFTLGGSYGSSSMDLLNDESHITQMYHNLLGDLFPSTLVAGLLHDPEENRTITPIFPKTLSSVLHGASMVRRENFIQQYDVGVPWNEPKHGATDVLVIYQSEHSLPSDYHARDTSSRNNNNIDDIDSTIKERSSSSSSSSDAETSPIRVSYDSAAEATSNCHSMKVVLIEPNTRHECVAIVPQWESFHVQHFLRIKPENMTTSRRDRKRVQIPHFQEDYPLRIVSRLDTLSGKSNPRIPLTFQIKKYWEMLLDYLTKLSATLERLKPLADMVVTSANNYHHSRTVVVMVCNFGQSELFVNFVCSARARNIDLSNILLFATDSDMYMLAKSLDITTFDVKDAFGDMPIGAAKVYGDRVFQGMMFSKVYCVHLISALGYDVLFQDVDVVWYRNPIQYFQSEGSGDFDFYFQDGKCDVNMSLIFHFRLTKVYIPDCHLLCRWRSLNAIYTVFTEFWILLRSFQRSNKILF